MDKPQILVHIEKPLQYTLFDAVWVPCSARVVCMGASACGAGLLQVYQMSHGALHHTADIQAKSSIKCATFSASSLEERQLATGDFSGVLHTWDIENKCAVFTGKHHKEIINSIDGVGGRVGKGAAEIVTGSRDGSVCVWDVRAPSPVVVIQPSSGGRDCWSVAFGDAYSVDARCLTAGYDNGDIKMFDLASMSLRWETNISNGVCSIQFDRKDIYMNKLLATTLESKVHVYDLKTQHKTKGFSGLVQLAHDSTVWLGRHLPQNREVMMTSGGGGSLCLWKYEYPDARVCEEDGEEVGVVGRLNLLQRTTCSSQPISSLDWSHDKQGLAVCTAFDQTLRVLLVTKLNLL